MQRKTISGHFCKRGGRRLPDSEAIEESRSSGVCALRAEKWGLSCPLTKEEKLKLRWEESDVHPRLKQSLSLCF